MVKVQNVGEIFVPIAFKVYQFISHISIRNFELWFCQNEYYQVHCKFNPLACKIGIG